MRTFVTKIGIVPISACSNRKDRSASVSPPGATNESENWIVPLESFPRMTSCRMTSTGFAPAGRITRKLVPTYR